MRYRLAGVLLLVVATVPVVPAAQTARQTPAATQQKMPVSFVCTMPADADVVEDKAGVCRKCGMELQPVRIESAWSCANNTSIIRDNAGKCPVDGRDLVPVTVAHFFVCNEAPTKFFPDGGKCGDGSGRVERREIRAHGDHNPRHDGQFFMATDLWHHVEGTYPSPGVFRAYFYDNFTKPLPGKTFSGTVSVIDKSNQVLGSFPLAPSRDGNTLEAKIPPALSGLPLNAAAKIKFDQKSPEQRFDFAFTALSKDSAPTSPVTSTAAASRPTTPKPVAPPTAEASSTRQATSGTTIPKPAAEPQKPAAPPAGAQEPAAQAPLILDSPTNIPPALADALDESKLPSAIPDLLAELTRRAKEVETLVNDGNLSQVWLPATGTKTVALVLDSRASSLPERQRTAVSASVKRIVTAAWELDAYGDLGNRRKITDAYQRLAAAITDLKAAYGQ